MTQNGQTRCVAIQMQQGVGACEGRLRSNNRAMVMSLTLHGLSDEETRTWIRAFREQPQAEPQQNRFELEVELLHSDYSHIGTKSGSKRFPDSLNIVKFDGSILRTDTDVVVAPGNTFIVSTASGAQLRVRNNASPELGLRDLIRVSGGGASKGKAVGISLKLATNITSKAHSGRHFVFRVNAREMNPQNQEVVSFWGVTEPFELFAKPTTSESSQETLRRQASAHSLASLASLASMGLQVCETEESFEDSEQPQQNTTAPEPTTQFRFPPANGSPRAAPGAEDPPSKKAKVDPQDAAVLSQHAAVWNVLAMAQSTLKHENAQPKTGAPAEAACKDTSRVDYLSALRPDCGNAATN
eukprot:TRINITY_DN20694_c0_g1_i1.p1 TRINITY_DN20694_c0_g1~~TRINITY_DN20694_c0_g1_i1.p1  ORF type:complete len:356 (+),score=64.18 TRINITY_DN20694_c0_g1_i1:324-1391(+)